MVEFFSFLGNFIYFYSSTRQFFVNICVIWIIYCKIRRRRVITRGEFHFANIALKMAYNCYIIVFVCSVILLLTTAFSQLIINGFSEPPWKKKKTAKTPINWGNKFMPLECGCFTFILISSTLLKLCVKLFHTNILRRYETIWITFYSIWINFLKCLNQGR